MSLGSVVVVFQSKERCNLKKLSVQTTFVTMVSYPLYKQISLKFFEKVFFLESFGTDIYCQFSPLLFHCSNIFCC